MIEIILLLSILYLCGIFVNFYVADDFPLWNYISRKNKIHKIIYIICMAIIPFSILLFLGLDNMKETLENIWNDKW